MISPALDYCVRLNELGWECDEPNDDNLFRPSKKWLVEFGAYLFRKRPFYKVEKFDCDNFAAWCVVLATESLLANPSVTNCDHSIIRCTFRVLKGPVLGGTMRSGKHAASLVWLDEGPIVLFEPQNGQFTDAQGLVTSGIIAPLLARW